MHGEEDFADSDDLDGLNGEDVDLRNEAADARDEDVGEQDELTEEQSEESHEVSVTYGVFETT